MKRAVLVMLLLCGCTEAERDRQRMAESAGPSLTVYVDGLTKCQYLNRGSNGLTPRLDRDGKPICGGLRP